MTEKNQRCLGTSIHTKKETLTTNESSFVQKSHIKVIRSDNHNKNCIMLKILFHCLYMLKSEQQLYFLAVTYI